MSGTAHPNGPAHGETESRSPDQPAENDNTNTEESPSVEPRVEESTATEAEVLPAPEPEVAAFEAPQPKPAVETPPVDSEVDSPAPVEASTAAEPPEPVSEEPPEPVSEEAPEAASPPPEEPTSVAEPVLAEPDEEAPSPEPAAPVVEGISSEPDEVAPSPDTTTPVVEPAPAAPAQSPVAPPTAPGSAPPPPPTEIGASEPSAPGKIVEGVVTQVSSDAVELTLDDGRPAVINRRNFGLNNEEPSSVLSVGDRAFGAELAREDPKNRVVLSRVWALKRQAWDKLAQQANEGEIIRCRVVSASKKGLVVDAGVRGFVPASHLELEPVRDFEPYLSETLELKILEIDPRREKLVLSRRAILQKAQRRERQELMGSLKVGEVRTGRIQSLADYGAFVDLGGVSGLVHLSELSWYRVGKPADVVKVGDEVEVKILDVKVKKRRISLSMRQTAPDPLKAIEVGGIVVGKVSRLVDFGAFVLIDGFEGLVHLSELAEYRVSTPEAVVAPGDEVRVKVLSVDPSRRRIELSIRRAAEYQG